MKYSVLMAWVSVTGLASQSLAADHFAAIQKKLGIPTSVATIVDASGKKPQFILIQDIHRHPEAQQQIAAMILHGLQHWGTKEIFIEGSWAAGEAPRDAAQRFPCLVDAVKEGRLGGAEMAVAIAPNQNFRFLGLEDEEAYRQNVAAYEAVEKVRPEALRELETTRLFGRILDEDSTQQWGQVKRLIELKLKPGEYAEYVKNPFRPTSNSSLASAVLNAELYYELANQRSRIFLEKATQLHRSGTEILVVGGFHTKAMAEELKKKDISYVVLSPVVTQGGFDGLYTRGMHDTVSALKLR